ncbi:MAG TPA: serine/threonine-protein kinase [Terriglobales bacterium]|nr:serine/threonine-protein kinase [Terriglobales bacterium]
MNADRWKRVDELLQSGLLVPSAERDEFLRRACAGDDQLELEVRSLLASHHNAGDFLENPALQIAARAIAMAEESAGGSDALLGQTISHYRVLEKLGSGGMGIVYQAEDVKLGRRVAMKFLPGEVASDRVAFERLQREARAASALDHPNICSIHELGEHAGQPFIVMQLLEGQTLRLWIEAESREDQRSRIGRTLDLAIQIANGLQAAHQKGIVHRDIKPANVFVTTRGDAKILDFGLAKVLKDPPTPEVTAGTAAAAPAPAADPAQLHLTLTGTTMGTASYMSPEQVRGEKLDARTDLFSLGLVIYEMVTGQKAFAGDTGPAIHDAILHHTPAPAREMNPAVPSALDRIIRKATEKDRTRRYGSAHELASDLEKLRAEIQTTGRNRKRIAVAAVLVTLAVGAGVLVQRYRHPAPSATVSAVKPRRSVAVLGFQNLSKKTDDDWISTALAEMVSTELAAGQQVRIIPGENVAHMKLDLALAENAGYGPDTLKKIQRTLGSDIIVQGSYLASPGSSLRIDMQLQEADASGTIAAVSENGSAAQIADLVSRAGVALRQQLGIPTISADDLDKTRAALPSDLEAARLYSEALAKLRNFDPLGARDLLVKAITADPNHALSHSLLAESLSLLGYDAQAKTEAKKALDLSKTLPRDNQLLIEGRFSELSNDFPAAIETYRSLWKFFPDELDYGLRLATAQNKVSLSKDALLTIAQLRNLPEPVRNDPRIDLAEANVTDSMGDFKRSQQVAAAAAEKAKLQGSRLLLSDARHREAWALDRLGEFDRSLLLNSECRDIALELGNLRSAAAAVSGMGSALYDKGDLEGARKAYEDALKMAHEVGAQRTITALTANIGNVFYDQGKYAEARPYYEKALEINRQIDNKRGIASDLGNLANVLQGIGNLAGSQSAQEEALQAFRDVGDRRGEAITLADLASVLFDRGELASARQRYEQVFPLLQQIGFQRGRVQSLLGLAAILEAEDHLPEARATALEALDLSKTLKDDSDGALSQWQSAKVAFEMGNVVEAEGLVRSAAEEFEREQSVANGCSSYALLSRVLLAQGKLKEAKTATDSALTLCQRGQARWARFQAELASAAVAFKAGDTAKTLTMLGKLHAEALQTGYATYEFESRLFIGEIELNSGKVASGRSRLEVLEKDAQSKGFSLIAHKARMRLKQS